MTDTANTFVDSDGNIHTVTHTTTVDPDTGETTVSDAHETVFIHDSADGAHAAGSTETVFHDVTTDTQGNTTTTDGVKGSDAEGNVSSTESSTDSNTGLTTVVTTTTDSSGEGTTHTTMVDAAGNTVEGPDGTPLDEVEEVHGEDGGSDGGGSDGGGSDGGGSDGGGSDGGGSEGGGSEGGGSSGGVGEDLGPDEDDPFFGLDIVKAAEEDD